MGLVSKGSVTLAIVAGLSLAVNAADIGYRMAEPVGVTFEDLTSPDGEITYSSELYGGDYYANAAFDNNTTDYRSRCMFKSGVTTGWVTYKFDEPTKVNMMGLYAADSSGNTRNPDEFQLLGSNDNENWTTLLSMTGQNAVIGGTHSRFCYAFDNDAAYTYYKFNVTKNGGASLLSFYELEYFYVPGHICPDKTNPDGQIVNSSALFTGCNANAAFDDDMTTSAGRWVISGKCGWVTYTFDAATCIDLMRIVSSVDNTANRYPKVFALQGSNDDAASESAEGVSWTTLFSATDGAYAAAGVPRCYFFTNTESFKTYRLYIENNNGDTYTAFQEIELCNRSVAERIVRVESASDEYGTTTPAYGIRTDLSGEVTFTATDGGDEDVMHKCIGYEVYENNVLQFSGSANTFTHTIPATAGTTSIRWIFADYYKVTSSVAGPGSGAVVVSGTEYAPDTGYFHGAVELTAEATSGSEFHWWLGNVAESASRDVTLRRVVDGPISLSAVFVPPDYSFDKYVSASGSDSADGNSAQTAYLTLGKAISVLNAGLAGGTVHVSGGTYEVEEAQTLTKGLRVVGAGPDLVVVRPAEEVRCRVFVLAAGGAELSGVTVSGGYLTDNVGKYSGGANVAVYGGMVSNCVIRGGYSKDSSGGLLLDGPTLETKVTNCKIIENTSSGTDRIAAGVTLRGGSLVNCLIAANVCSGTGSAAVGGVMCDPGTAPGEIVNCTIAGNTGPRFGGLVMWRDNNCPSRLVNTVLAGNSVNGNGQQYAKTGETSLKFFVIEESELDAVFRNPAQGDWRLADDSRLIDQGDTVEGLASVDLAGRQRVWSPRNVAELVIDIGCYEWMRHNGLVLIFH